VVNKVQQGGVELAVEPPRGAEKPEPAPVPKAPPVPQAPRTPERVAAEKEVIKQILATDDTTLNPVDPALSEIKKLKEELSHIVEGLTSDNLASLVNIAKEYPRYYIK
jgi:hypothetical protein